MIFRLSVWIVMIFGGIFGGYYIDSILFKDIHNNLIFHFISLLFGVIVLVLVMKISKNTGRTLAKYGRKGELKRLETNVFVQEGVYQYMRHPMHLGLLFFPLAFALLVGSPSFIIFIVPSEIVMMLIMIKLFEEPEAIGKFEDEYRTYMKKTPWFCFKIKCLKELFKEVDKE